MKLSFNSKDPYVPNPKQDPSQTRWIASLSDGSTVFQDNSPGETSSWRRLQEYIQMHGLKMTNLRLEAYGHQINLMPYKDDEGTPQVNGYWYSRRVGALMSSSYTAEVNFVGIGIVKGKDIWINWVDHNGMITEEYREYKPGDLAAIINDPT